MNFDDTRHSTAAQSNGSSSKISPFALGVLELPFFYPQPLQCGNLSPLCEILLSAHRAHRRAAA